MEYATILNENIKTEKRCRRGRYCKGNIPENKGTKGVLKANKTSFKKGVIPENTKPVGTISVRHHKRSKINYKVIKVADHKWEPLNRYIWKLHNGDIPASHIVAFKDGDSLNCDIDNLFLLSRADNVRRNFNVKKIVKTKKIKHLRKIYGIGNC